MRVRETRPFSRFQRDLFQLTMRKKNLKIRAAEDGLERKYPAWRVFIEKLTIHEAHI